MKTLRSIAHRAWNNPVVLGATAITCLWIAYSRMFADIEIRDFSCESAHGRAVMGYDDKAGSFLTLFNRSGTPVYETARMYNPVYRKELAQKFCDTGTAPDLLSEIVGASYPPIYQCVGHNGQKAAAIPANPHQVRILRYKDGKTDAEVIAGQIMNGAWYAQRFCSNLP